MFSSFLGLRKVFLNQNVHSPTPSPLSGPAVYEALLDGYCACANAVLSFPTRVLESIKAGKRLPEARFVNLNIAAKGQHSVLSAFSKNKPPA